MAFLQFDAIPCAPTSRLLLSEVALGNMYECTDAQYIIGPDQNVKTDADSKHYSHIALPQSKHSAFVRHFAIVLDQFSRISQLRATPHTPCNVIYAM